MDDAALLQYLVGKYPLTDLVHMLRNTAGSELEPMHEGTKPSGPVGPIPTVADSNPSPVSFSDASSLNGSLYSACSEASIHKVSVTSAPKPIVRHCRARSASRKALSKLASSRTPARPSCPPPTKKRAIFECPFCAERCITVEISRKNDLKRHFTDFHAGNSVWHCAVRGCQMIFDWKSAYVAHIKTAHRGVGPPAQDVVIDTCPQVVFGCGFNNCKRVFEAVSDLDAGQKAHDYFAHVAEHFEDGLSHKDWSYSTRFRNLMRQELVEDAWKSRKKTSQQSSAWQPLSSFTLRKMLECRHISDVPLFVQWATTLCSMAYGNPRTPQPKLPAQFLLPARQSCPFAQFDHRSDRSCLSIMPSPQEAFNGEPQTPAAHHLEGNPVSPPSNYPTTFPLADGLPAVEPWMHTIPPAHPDLMPVDPLVGSASVAGPCPGTYTEDTAMIFQGQSFDLWPDITFDPTFDTQFQLPAAAQESGLAENNDQPHGSLPASPLTAGYPLSTTSTASSKDTKMSDISTLRFTPFNMH